MAQLKDTLINGDISILRGTIQTTSTDDLSLMNYASTTQLIKQVVRYKFIPYLISLSFKDNKHMTGSHTFDGTVFAAWCQMEYRYSTPVDQVNTVYCSYEENTVTVTAAGSGFVNGHVLVVNILALIQY